MLPVFVKYLIEYDHEMYDIALKISSFVILYREVSILSSIAINLIIIPKYLCENLK